MVAGATSSARSPSHTKMMTLRGADPLCCGVAGPPSSPSTTNDRAMKKMSLFVFMVVLVSEFEGGRSQCRPRRDRARSSRRRPLPGLTGSCTPCAFDSRPTLTLSSRGERMRASGLLERVVSRMPVPGIEPRSSCERLLIGFEPFIEELLHGLEQLHA